MDLAKSLSRVCVFYFYFFLFNGKVFPGCAAIYAGKPGRLQHPRPSESEAPEVVYVTEWAQCVRSLTTSSRQGMAHHMLETSSSFWESCGTRDNHWIRIEMQPDVLVKSLQMVVDPLDCSYMPSLVTVYGGEAFNCSSELTTVSIQAKPA